MNIPLPSFSPCNRSYSLYEHWLSKCVLLFLLYQRLFDVLGCCRLVFHLSLTYSMGPWFAWSYCLRHFVPGVDLVKRLRPWLGRLYRRLSFRRSTCFLFELLWERLIEEDSPLVWYMAVSYLVLELIRCLLVYMLLSYNYRQLDVQLLLRHYCWKVET